MTILPKSHLGKWAFGIAITFVVLLLVSIAAFVAISFGPVEPSRIFLVVLITDVSAMVISAVGALIIGLFSLQNNREHSVLIYSSLTLTLLGILFLAVFVFWSPKQVSDEDIIKLILDSGSSQGRYDVINPQMSGQYISDSESTILYYFQQEGLGSLANNFVTKNTQPKLMDIPSSPDHGYVIDYDGKYESYFEGGQSDGWIKFRQENPKAGAMIDFSIPAYDPVTGLAMINIEWSGDGLMGGGGIYVYKYIFGRLIPINYLLLSMS